VTTRWVAIVLGGPEVLRMQTVELRPPGPILRSPLWLQLLIGRGAKSRTAADRFLALAWPGLKTQHPGSSPNQAQSHGSLLRSSPVSRAVS